MLDQVMRALKKAGIDSYLIRETCAESLELFFVKKNLDMRRGKKVTEVEVTVYRPFKEGEEEYLGHSVTHLFVTMEEDEMISALKNAYESAVYVKNKPYTLYRGHQEEKVIMSSGLNGQSLGEVAGIMTEALFRNDQREDAFLNSAELFVRQNDIHVISSTGTDVAYQERSVWCEFVVQAKEPVDVEQYFSLEYTDLQPDAMAEEVRKALDQVHDRAHAQKEPAAGNYDLILSGKNLAEILSFYAARASAQMVYPKYSDYTVGAEVQGKEIKGEKLNITMVPAAPYSAEGIPMKERALLKDGKLKMIFGSNRFSCYLGIEPTGDYRRMSVDNGSVPFEELKKGCLYPVSFSDFQMDELSGHFAGEIRLAYLYSGKGVEVLTGGSINGSLIEKQDNLVFSQESFRNSEYSGPFAVKITNIAVSGKE